MVVETVPARAPEMKVHALGGGWYGELGELRARFMLRYVRNWMAP